MPIAYVEFANDTRTFTEWGWVFFDPTRMEGETIPGAAVHFSLRLGTARKDAPDLGKRMSDSYVAAKWAADAIVAAFKE